MRTVRTGFVFALALLALAPAGARAQGSQPAVTTNRSAVITTGDTFQTILAAGNRRSLTIQNNNVNLDYCWIFVGSGTATKAASIILAVTQAYTRYFPYIPNDVIQATCTSTSDTIYVDTQ